VAQAQTPDAAKSLGAKPSAKKAARPKTTTTSLELRVRAVVLTQRSARLRKIYGVKSLAKPQVLLTRVDQAKGWAFGTSVIAPPAGSAALPDPALFLARLKSGTWQVSMAGTKSFVQAVKAAPVTVVPKAERPLLARYGAPATPKPGVATGLMFPWKVGESWTLQPTTGDSGLQFSGGDGRVLAPSAGRFYRLCTKAPGRGMLLLIHANGLASAYYQLTGVPNVKDGTLVKQGTFLGKVGTDQSCAGTRAPGSPVVNFGLFSGNGLFPLDGTQIGGWTLHTGDATADTGPTAVPTSGPTAIPTAAATATATTDQVWADNSGVRVDVGNPLLNFGTSVTTPASPDPTPTPSPTPS
jgi:LasA protease